jgi:hypothetical protein
MMNKKLGDKIGDAIQALMKEKFPEVGWMFVATTDDSADFLVTGNACVVCCMKNLAIEVVTGRIKHLNNHMTEQIDVINLDDLDKKVH